MNIQWYPGHMTKAKRAMQEDLKLVDLVIEITDARVPLSGRNPDLYAMAKDKSRVVIFNKADLADPARTKRWMERFSEEGLYCMAMDARSGEGKKQIQAVIAQATKEKTERDRKRGILNRPVRAMVAGIPNSGKSTFINTMAGKASAKTGNKPGVTRGNQWIRLNKQLELLDTPGILWPKFEDSQVGLKLALIGSIKDDILNVTELSWELIRFLQREYPKALPERYGLEEAAEKKPEELLSDIAVARNCLKKGGEADTDRAAALVLEDFRSGRLGRITLESVSEA